MKQTELDYKEQYERSLRRLSSVLELEKELWRCDSLQEALHIMVNNSRNVIEYTSAMFFKLDKKNATILQVSDISTLSSKTKFKKELELFCYTVSKLYNDENVAGQISLRDFPSLVDAYGKRFILTKFHGANTENDLYLVLFRNSSFLKGELIQLKLLQESFREKIIKLQYQKTVSKSTTLNTLFKICLAILVISVCFFPTRFQVVVNAEVEPKEALIVRSPINGIIEDVYVSPFEHVKKGQRILKLDPSKVLHELKVAKSEYRSKLESLKSQAQQSLYQATDNSQILIEKKMLELYYAKVQYLIAQTKKTEIVADKDGIVLFNSRNDLIGMPVDIGQKILLISDPTRKKLRAYMNVNDAIKINKGDSIMFYNEDISSGNFSALINHIEYKPIVTTTGELAYVIHADFVDENNSLNIGSAGKAKVLGDETIGIFRFLRVPISYFRPYLSW